MSTVSLSLFFLFLPSSPPSLSLAKEVGRYVHQPRPGEEAGHHLRVRHCQTHAAHDSGQLSPKLPTLYPAKLLLTPPSLFMLDSYIHICQLLYITLAYVTLAPRVLCVTGSHFQNDDKVYNMTDAPTPHYPALE